MSTAEVKCPDEFFVREERRRPRFFMDFFSLSLLVLGILVFGMACYVFFGCSKMEKTAPSALSQVDHNNSEQYILSRIERMVKQLLRNSERSEQIPSQREQSFSSEETPFWPIFKRNELNDRPVRTRLIFRFGLPPSAPSIPPIMEVPTNNKQTGEEGKDPNVVISRSRINFIPLNGVFSEKDKTKESKETSVESKESSEDAPNHSQSFPAKPGDLNRLLNSFFDDMDNSLSGFPDQFSTFVKPHFTSIRRSAWPFSMNLKNDPSSKAPENEPKETPAPPESTSAVPTSPKTLATKPSVGPSNM